MTPTIPVTRRDAQTLYALASLARHQAPSKRSAHLVAEAEEIARRIVAATADNTTPKETR